MVEHHLAKVGVAGSNPVLRSIVQDEPMESDLHRLFCEMATWPSGKAEACKAFTPGSNPGVASSYLDRQASLACRCALHIRAFSSGGERFPDTEEVRSSNLLTPTRNSQTRGYALWSAFISAVQALRTWHEPLHVLNRPGPLGRHTYPRHISACTRPYAWMLQPSTFVGKSCFGMTRVACRRKSVGSSASLPAG